MKIGYVSRAYFPQTTGGGEIHLNQIMMRASMSGHEVRLITIDLLESNSEINISNANVSGFPASMISGSSELMRYSKKLESINFYKEFLKAEKFDLLHFYNLHDMIPFLLAALELRIGTVVTALDFFLFCRRSDHMRYGVELCPLGTRGAECEKCLSLGWSKSHIVAARSASLLFGAYDHEFRSAIMWLTKRDLFPSLGQRAISAAIEAVRREILVGSVIFVAPSKYMAKFLSVNGIPGDKIREIPYGTDIVAHQHKRKIEHSVKIGFIGRCVPQKGIMTLLMAMEKLQSMSSLTLDIYFPETEGDFVNSVTKKVGLLTNTKIVGKAERKDLPEIFSKMEFLVVPSEWPENSPIIISEAHACGVPVLCSDFAGLNAEAAVEKGVILFRMGDVDDLVDKIIGLQQSEDLRAYIDQIPPIPTIQDTYEVIEQLYTEVINQKRYEV